MPFTPANLSLNSTVRNGLPQAQTVTRFFDYASRVDMLDAMSAAGYFNAARELLRPGDVIRLVDAAGGQARRVVVAVVPASGNVTVNRRASIIQSTERLFAMRTQPLGDATALTGGRNIVLTRMQLLLGHQAFSQVRFKFASWFHTSGAVTTNKEQAGPQGFMIVGAALERRTLSAPAFVTAPILFGGQRGATLANGDSEVWSDPILTGFGTPAQPLAAASTLFIRVAIDVGADGSAVRHLNLATSLTATLREQGVLGTSSDPVAIRALVDGTDDITAAAFADGSAVNWGHGPILAVGVPSSAITPDLPVIIQGSSFTEGSGDSAYTGSATSGGFALRGLQSIGSPVRKLPAANYGKGSGMWAEIGASNTRRERAWQHARVLILDGPTNDLASSINPTAIMASWDQIRARADAHGLFKIVTLVTPRCTGTYANDAGQTPVANFAAGTNRDTVNAALIARWQAGEIDMLIDPNLGRVGLRDHATWQDLSVSDTLRLQSTTATDRWFPSTTTDGIHPNATGHGIMGPLVDWCMEDLYTNYATIWP
jgi:hypothetical protein